MGKEDPTAMEDSLLSQAIRKGAGSETATAKSLRSQGWLRVAAAAGRRATRCSGIFGSAAWPITFVR